MDPFLKIEPRSKPTGDGRRTDTSLYGGEEELSAEMFYALLSVEGQIH